MTEDRKSPHFDDQHIDEVMRLVKAAYKAALKELRANLAAGHAGQGYGAAKSFYGGAAVTIAAEAIEPMRLESGGEREEVPQITEGGNA